MKDPHDHVAALGIVVMADGAGAGFPTAPWPSTPVGSGDPSQEDGGQRLPAKQVSGFIHERMLESAGVGLERGGLEA